MLNAVPNPGTNSECWLGIIFEIPRFLLYGDKKYIGRLADTASSARNFLFATRQEPMKYDKVFNNLHQRSLAMHCRRHASFAIGKPFPSRYAPNSCVAVFMCYLTNRMCWRRFFAASSEGSFNCTVTWARIGWTCPARYNPSPTFAVIKMALIWETMLCCSPHPLLALSSSSVYALAFSHPHPHEDSNSTSPHPLILANLILVTLNITLNLILSVNPSLSEDALASSSSPLPWHPHPHDDKKRQEGLGRRRK